MTQKQEKHLIRQVKKDKIYQDFLELQKTYEPEYTRILHSLSLQDQYYLKMYLRVCEGLDARTIRTAYFLTPKP